MAYRYAKAGAVIAALVGMGGLAEAGGKSPEVSRELSDEEAARRLEVRVEQARAIMLATFDQMLRQDQESELAQWFNWPNWNNFWSDYWRNW